MEAGRGDRCMAGATRLLHAPQGRGVWPLAWKVLSGQAMRFAVTAAALSASLALAGCGPPPPPCSSGSLTVDWRLLDPSGALRSCSGAGVAFVDIYLDGTRQVDAAPCGNGTATLGGLSFGSHPITVEGLDASLQIVDREQFSAQTGCGNTRVLANAGEGLLNLDYVFAPTNACGAGPTYVWFQVTDLIANTVISAITSQSSDADKVIAPCSASSGFTFAVPLGRYQLDWIGEIANPYGSPPTLLYQDCTPSTVGVTGPGTFLLPATLTNASGQASCVR